MQASKATGPQIPAVNSLVHDQHKCGPELAERLLEIGNACATQLKEPVRSIDHGDYLYGDQDSPD